MRIGVWLQARHTGLDFPPLSAPCARRMAANPAAPARRAGHVTPSIPMPPVCIRGWQQSPCLARGLQPPLPVLEARLECMKRWGGALHAVQPAAGKPHFQQKRPIESVSDLIGTSLAAGPGRGERGRLDSELTTVLCRYGGSGPLARCRNQHAIMSLQACAAGRRPGGSRRSSLR